MDEEAFALTGIAFPVAPTTLGGFTLDGFQWDEFGDDEDEPGIPGGIFRRAFWSWDRIWKWRPGMAAELEPMQFVKTVSDSRMFGFDYSDAPEVANGSTIIDPMASGTVSGGSGLTVGSVTVNSAAFDDIPATGGLQARISGGTAGTTYSFAIIGTTVGGSVLTIPCEMVVVADA